MQRSLGAALAAGIIFANVMPASAGVGRTAAPFASRSRAGAVATTGWVATQTQAMSPANAIHVGTVPASMPMSVVVGLKTNRAAGEAYLRHIYTPGDSLYHHFMTPATYNATLAPSYASAAAVARYLTSAGFTNVQIAPNNLIVTADGNASTVSHAFNTQIDAFAQAGKAIYVNVTPAMVPAQLGGVVLSVLGLQNVPMHLDSMTAQQRAAANAALVRRAASKPRMHPNLATCTRVGGQVVPIPGGFPCPDKFYTKDLRTFYDAQSGETGANTDEAVFTEGNVSEIPNDIKQNAAANNLPSFPITVVQVTKASGDTSGITEFAMDTQTSTGIAGGVRSLTLYNSSLLNDGDVTRAFNRWATDDFAEVASASFGECEYQAELDGAMALDDQIFLQSMLQGQTIFVSSGDSGSSCGFNIVTNGVPGAGPPMVEYPTTSPYVMSAGGTTINANADKTYNLEIAWNSGGGGLSYFEPPEFWTLPVVAFQCLPVYCQAIGPGLPVALTGGMARAVPDVAMDADAEVSAARFYQGSGWTSNGGTSLAAPLSAGVYDVMQSMHGESLGHAGPQYYANYVNAGGGTGAPIPSGPAVDQPVGGFHDVLVGANGVYTALPGYDLTTGLGSVDIHALASQLGR